MYRKKLKIMKFSGGKKAMYPNNYPGYQPYQGANYSTPYYNTQYPTTPQMTGSPVVPPPMSSPTTGPQVPGMLPIEESYIENILRLNKGKLVTVYATFENNTKWNAQIFKGIIEAAGRDHLILSVPETGQRILMPMLYLDYVTFDEEIEYDYPYGGPGPSLSNYSPR
jgi:spore germination protein Q